MSGARNPDVLAKMAAVFDSYWASTDFVPYDPAEFRTRTERRRRRLDAAAQSGRDRAAAVSGAAARATQSRAAPGHHRNLLVCRNRHRQDGHGGGRLRATPASCRATDCSSLRIATRSSSRAEPRFAHALRDASFGEMWVGGDRPYRFDHVFASIQSLNASGVERIDPDHFDVVIVDEFHHAAAPSYRQLLEHVSAASSCSASPPRQSAPTGLTSSTISAAVSPPSCDSGTRSISSTSAPFDYFGIHDGLDLRGVAWRRGRGYDVEQLTNVLTADHVWANRVIEQVGAEVTRSATMRALGFCVSVEHARFMAERFQAAGIPAVAIWGETAADETTARARGSRAGTRQRRLLGRPLQRGSRRPDVDTLLCLRPTDSPTLFLQQLGRGLRKAADKPVCTVLDFVGNHRKEFRYDRRFRALLGGSRKEVIGQIEVGLPVPAGRLPDQPRTSCSGGRASQHPERDPDSLARQVARAALARRCQPGEYLDETGLDLEDVYEGSTAGPKCGGLPASRPESRARPRVLLLRAVGRLTHVDDDERIDAFRSFVLRDEPPDLDGLVPDENCTCCACFSARSRRCRSASLAEARDELWRHAQVRSELAELLEVLPGCITHLSEPLSGFADVPLRVHARYTRIEILAALGFGRARSQSPGKAACSGTKKLEPTCSRSRSTRRQGASRRLRATATMRSAEI